MALLTKKIKGATLIESLIAMLIVMLCFGIAITVYVNVISSGNQLQKLKSELLLKQIAVQTKNAGVFLDEKMTLDGIVVQKKIVPYNGLKHLIHLNLKAYSSSEKLLSEYNELVPVQ